MKPDGYVTDEFGAALGFMAEAWPGSPAARLTPGKLAFYAQAMHDIPIDAVRRACARAVRESRYFPTVAELRSYAVPSVDDAALLAWTAIRRAAELVGAYSSVTLEDSHAAAAVEQVFGGWAQFCQECQEGPALAQRRAEFVAAYRQAARRPAAPARRLAGLLEGSTGYRPDGRSLAALVAADGHATFGPDTGGSVSALIRRLTD